MEAGMKSGMEVCRRIVACFARVAIACLVTATIVVAAPAMAGAATAQWMTSGMDLYFYSNALNPGTKGFGPTFANQFETDEQSDEFLPQTADDPARLSMALVAFDTSLHIAAGLPQSRYHVDAVTMTFKMESGSGSDLHYDNTPDGRDEVLGQATGDPGRPAELYGVGFRGGYTGYAFSGGSASGPNLFTESVLPTSGPEGSYIAYPIVADEEDPGQYKDVSNSVTGGDSATHGTTEAFDPTPWAIGTANLSAGNPIPKNTTFTFSLDLSQPGVRRIRSTVPGRRWPRFPGFDAACHGRDGRWRWLPTVVFEGIGRLDFLSELVSTDAVDRLSDRRCPGARRLRR